jgi:hypothetical protein
VYYALYQSHLSYGVILWGNCSDSYVTRVLKLQKSAIRILAGLDYTDSCRHFFKNMKILKLSGLYVYNLVFYVKSNIGNRRQECVGHSHPTRNKENFVRPPKHATSKYEMSVSFAGLKFFIMLPNKEIKCLDLSMFKIRVRKFLVCHPMYNVNEIIACDKSSM